MSDLREWLRLVEAQPEEDEDGESIDERLEELADLLLEWIDTDPNMMEDYKASKIALARSLLLYEDIAAKFRHVSASVLYRGVTLRKPVFNVEGHLIVRPRRTDVLESWTTDAPMANLHAIRPSLVDPSVQTRTMSRSAQPFVIAEQVARLPVWINMKAFLDHMGRYTNENEVLVKAGARVYTSVREAD